MEVSLLVLLEHSMIGSVKIMKLHVNYVHLVPTAQSAVEIVLMCASNVRPEHTTINLVSFDSTGKKKRLFLKALVYIIATAIKLLTEYFSVFSL
jgi:hypothetical protein